MSTLIMAVIFSSPIWIFGLILYFGKAPEMDWHEPEETEPQAQPVAKHGKNVIDIDTIRAMAYIANHDDMRFIEKT